MLTGINQTFRGYQCASEFDRVFQGCSLLFVIIKLEIKIFLKFLLESVLYLWHAILNVKLEFKTIAIYS